MENVFETFLIVLWLFLVYVAYQQASSGKVSLRSLSSSRVGLNKQFAVAPEDQDGYISVVFPEEVDSQYQDVFIKSAAYWNTVILSSELEPLTLVSDLDIQAYGCEVENNYIIPAGTEIDGLIILAEVINIDGRGGVLGQATPCLFIKNMPVVGYMQFDSSDLSTLSSNGLLEAVILHEMAHVIGFGSLWQLEGLVEDACPQVGSCFSDPRYIGPNGTKGYSKIGGSDNPPVANEGGPGTINVHWRESTFDNELMTGFINEGQNPVSIMTIRSFEDLGYVVNYSAAEEYAIPSCMNRCGVVQPDLPCQCDTNCLTFNDCCADYESACNSDRASGPPSVPGIVEVPKEITSLPTSLPTKPTFSPSESTEHPTSTPSLRTIPTYSPSKSTEHPTFMPLEGDVIPVNSTKGKDLKEINDTAYVAIVTVVVVIGALMLLTLGIGITVYLRRKRSHQSNDGQEFQGTAEMK